MSVEAGMPSLKHIEEDEWYGGDSSCCYFVPMNIAVRILGALWAMNLIGLIIEIQTIDSHNSY